MVKVWARPVSLATTPGIVVYFLFLWVLRCFSSPAYRYPSLCVQLGATWHYPCEVSPFGNPRFKACEAAPRGLSQPSTSFFGVLCQGILYVRLSNFLRSDFSHRVGYVPAKPKLYPLHLANYFIQMRKVRDLFSAID
jgi:hypothetical protein